MALFVAIFIFNIVNIIYLVIYLFAKFKCDKYYKDIHEDRLFIQKLNACLNKRPREAYSMMKKVGIYHKIREYAKRKYKHKWLALNTFDYYIFHHTLIEYFQDDIEKYSLEIDYYNKIQEKCTNILLEGFIILFLTGIAIALFHINENLEIMYGVLSVIYVSLFFYRFAENVQKRKKT